MAPLLRKEHFKDNHEIDEEVRRRHAHAFLNWSGFAVANFFNFQCSGMDICDNKDVSSSYEEWEEIIRRHNFHAFSLTVIRQGKSSSILDSDFYADTIYFNKFNSHAIAFKQQNIPQKILDEGVNYKLDANGRLLYSNAPQLSSLISIIPFFEIKGTLQGIMDALGILC